MKRILLHIAFWLAYVLQDTVLMVVWVEPSLPADTPDNVQLWKATMAVLLSLIPKLLLTYYLLYVSVHDFQSGRKKMWVVGVEVVVVTTLAILINRTLSVFITNPIIYDDVWPPTPFIGIRPFLSSLMEIGFVAGTAVAIKLARIQLSGKEREKNLVKEKLETELKFLRNQTNPHFLMNTLNNIYALARKKSDDTAEIVMKLSELLRFILYESGQDRIALTDEIKVLEDYLELEKVRYNNRLAVSFDKNIDSNAYQITPLLLLPFVENAFKHGVSETRFQSFVRIDMHVEKSYLNFIVENSKDCNPRHSGANNIGLYNVRRQLELMYKEFRLDVQNGDSTFKVHLTVNLNNHVEI